MIKSYTNIILRFYSWWIDELSALITPERKGGRSWRTLLFYSNEGLEIFQNVDGKSVALATLKDRTAVNELAAAKSVLKEISRDPGHILLRLSPGDVLERTIQIPKAASDVIEPVLHNQMERIVPWPQDESQYGFEVVGENESTPGQLDIRVVATRKTILSSAIASAETLGFSPFAIDYAPKDGMRAGIELMSLEPDPRKKNAQSLHKLMVLLLAVSVTISGFGFYHMWGSQTESNELEARLETIRSRVSDITRLNAENTKLKEQRERLVKRKSDEPAVMVLLETLSRVLPDNAFLTELEVHGRETRIAGKSHDPTALITMIESAAQFDNVRFAAPTTREENENIETFSIIAKAGPGPLREESP